MIVLRLFGCLDSRICNIIELNSASYGICDFKGQSIIFFYFTLHIKNIIWHYLNNRPNIFTFADDSFTYLKSC